MPKLHITSVRGPHIAQLKSSGKAQVEVRIGQRFRYIPILERVDRLNLNLRTIIVTTKRGTTINGVTINVTACCQVKLHAWTIAPSGELQYDQSAIRLAAQHFLARSDDQIDHCIRNTVAGHQRAIIGTLTVEQLYRDRDAFSKRVSDLCYNDLRNMGVCIVSYTVADITDEHGYLEALGVTHTEIVKRAAAEGSAFHQNQARARKAKEEVDAHIHINQQLIRQLTSDKSCQIRKVDAQAHIDRKLAAQNKAPLITDAEQDTQLFVKRQKARSARAEAQLAVVRHQIEVERLVKQQTVHVHADAMLYKATVDAHTVRQTARAEADTVTLAGHARADADAALIRACGSAHAHADALYHTTTGLAEADAFREKGLADVDVRLADAHAIKATRMAEADVMREALQMWNQFGSRAFIVDKIVDELPNIAAAVAAPLANTGKMVFVGGGGCDDDASQTVDGTGMHAHLAGEYRQNGCAQNGDMHSH